MRERIPASAPVLVQRVRRTIRRLTFVSDAPQFGGGERYMVAMAHAARRRGIEPHIYWCRLPGADADVFSSANTDGLDVTVADPVRTRDALGMTREFRTTLERQRPDGLVINASGRPRYWLGTWLARRAGIPSVWVHQMVDACDHRRLPPKRLGP